MSSESRFPAWAWGIAGAITVLALTILVFSVVMGIRAGQDQVEIQQRQQIGIALQQATDLQIEGRLTEALAQYQKVLILDPNNAVAQQGIQNLLTLAAAGTPVAAVVPAPAAAQQAAATSAPTQAPAVATTAAVTATAATPAGDPALAAWERAQAAGKAGRWQVVLDELIALRQSSPGFRPAEVTALLGASYTNLAAASDNADNLEEALTLYDKALALQPDPTIQSERDLISMYLDALTYSDADWPRAIQALEDLYAEEPQYRDVESRLQDAHTAYGDQLAGGEQWCLATEEYESALSVINNPTIATKRDAAETECAQNGDLAASGGLTGTTITSATAGSTLGVPGGAPTATSAPVTSGDTTDESPKVGTLLYSAKDINSGRPQIWEMPVRLGTAQLLLQDAAQPAMRGDGTRLAFRNLRSNMAGISGFDPDTGLTLRFTTYAEDSTPSWNPQGSRIVFASNREGDRRWRIYTVWAENDGATETLGFGESPSWSPSADQIAYRGCDDSGNNCGIWTMSGNSNNHVPLTRVPEDTHPAWAPNASFVAFMSSSRDGNNDIYRVDTATGEVINLTANPGLDALPAVSPDGEWVAFVSNRDGAWKIYAVPASGGAATLIAPIIGDLGNWSDQGLQWTW